MLFDLGISSSWGPFLASCAGTMPAFHVLMHAARVLSELRLRLHPVGCFRLRCFLHLPPVGQGELAWVLVLTSPSSVLWFMNILWASGGPSCCFGMSPHQMLQSCCIDLQNNDSQPAFVPWCLV